MKALVVYESVHGNTEKIAQAIGEGIGGDVEVRRGSQVSASDLAGFDLIVVGAPTHGGRPSPDMQAFLRKVGASVWNGKRVAAFDTRIPARWVKIFGFAAPRMARKFKKAGATLVAEPEGFFVKDTEGPLLDGEAERATEWGKRLGK